MPVANWVAEMLDDSRNHEEATLPPKHSFDRSRDLIEAAAFGVIARIMGLFIHHGRINLRYRNLCAATLGREPADSIDVTIRHLGALYKMLRQPDLAIGECYMAGEWNVREENLAKLIGVLLQNDKKLEQTMPLRILNAVREAIDTVFRPNDTERSRKNASHHYDIGNDLYELFLDPEMLYSCAFYAHMGQSLEDAQKNKLKITLDRLDVAPGMKVLDIGCGWGAVTRAIAERGAEAVGITLADQQLVLAEQRVPEHLRNLITYQLQDYRVHAAENIGRYDRVVSIGMFEHVGRPQFETYFASIQKLLKPDGRAVVHSIVKDMPSRTNEWVDKYIFPGGCIPRIEDMSNSALAAKLEMPHDPFVHESHNYAQTLRHWRERFNERFDELDPEQYDTRFRRMWNFYLAGSEAAFDHIGYRVAQIVVENTANPTNRSRPQRRLPLVRQIRRKRSEQSDARDRGQSPRQKR
jgi:cyclopropane-fatty-acyl-phospholipid synthase